MTTLADNLVPDQLWELVEPCSRSRRVRRMVAGTAPSPTGPASPQSSIWPGPPPRGGFCPPASLAAAPRRPAGAGWQSGPTLGCSTPYTFGSWTALVKRAGWTGSGRAWTQRASAPSVGGPGGRKSRRSGQAWVQAALGLRWWRAAPDRGGDRGQRQRHHHVPGGRGGHPADPDTGWAATHPTRQDPC
jgi:hypothetical protein